MDQLNYYELLGVKENASFDEIKSAYKNQMKKWHPDVNSDSKATEMSIALNEAKKILLDEELRKQYDLSLEKKRQDNYNQVFGKDKKSYSKEKTSESDDYINQDVYVSKWVYFKEWLEFGNASKFRKTIGALGVLLETLLCKIIIALLYIVFYICVYSSVILQYIFSVFGGTICLLLGLIILSSATSASSISNLLIVVVLIVVILYFINIIPNILLSPKVFDFLYNKFDVYLFKKCVGYSK